MTVRYSYQKMKDNMATAYGRNLSISTKKSVEVCRNIRGKNIAKAKKMLQDVMDMKTALPMRRFIRDLPHQKGIGPGRFPVKTIEEIMKVLKSAEANAQNKGLSTKDLIIVHAAAHKASKPWHFGRNRGRKMKRSHIEIVLEEVKEQKTPESKK